ncbi:coiled-coil domain-containing protein 55-domain containing protein [Gautieria morchelliformis]|nr:coiled-coil domain-containing protein 55-domain containing protein [Gautieria morchelliformis]
MKLSFSLKGKAVGTAPSLKPATPFASLEDDILDAAPTALTSRAEAQKHLVAQSSSATSRATRKKLEEEKKLDKTIFEYDEVYDVMEQAKQRSKEKRDIEAQERKPKYIGSLLTSAATRKLDYIRAEEKMIQREREQEGDEFADKEQFVTQAYKDQMAEVRRAEEEEKRREGPSTGMAHFYRQLLERSEEEHSATVTATTQSSQPVIGPQGPNLTITKPVGFAAKSDLELAHAARAEGKEVELNDDNQIVDKRELLSAGLNLAAPNTRQLGGLRASRIKVAAESQEVQAHRATGAAASRREINERRARELERQIAEEQERLNQQKEREEREEMERVVAKRNNDEAIEKARFRYLERKRRKLEDGTAVTGEVA